MNELMRVAQLPVIEEQLRTMKESVDKRVEEALALVCTPETVGVVKQTRAELNKEFAQMEEQRKAIKAAVMQPYIDFESVYKECVSDAYKAADATLKDRLDEVENDIKQRCEDGLRAYFAELCQLYRLEWLTYERAGIKVDMASAKAKTPTKLRKQIDIFVERVANDVETLYMSSGPDAAEIITEYKQSLDPCRAILTVQERHKRIEEEESRVEGETAAREAENERVKQVEALASPTVSVDEPLLSCTFTVKATGSQLKSIKEFLEKEGIKYE